MQSKVRFCQFNCILKIIIENNGIQNEILKLQP